MTTNLLVSIIGRSERGCPHFARACRVLKSGRGRLEWWQAHGRANHRPRRVRTPGKKQPACGRKAAAMGKYFAAEMAECSTSESAAGPASARVCVRHLFGDNGHVSPVDLDPWEERQIFVSKSNPSEDCITAGRAMAKPPRRACCFGGRLEWIAVGSPVERWRGKRGE